MSSTLRDDPGFGDGSDRAFSRRRFVGDREILRKVPDLQATSHNHHYRALNLSAFSTARKPREHGELGYLTWGNFGLVDGS